jgi:hypothetical protein
VKLYLAIFIILFATPVFSQIIEETRDSTRNETRTTPPPVDTNRTIIPFDTNRIYSPYRLSWNSNVFGQNNWIWNDRRNLGEILSDRPGYLVNFITDGGRSILNYNESGQTDFGVFKDGIQINDNIYGGFDIENIALNEIDSVEEVSYTSSFLYGIKSQGRAINIITKDVFQPELFSQLRFTQDRYGSEHADVYFSQSISRKVNWQIGASKHSLTGRYVNSDFDVWRARTRVNFFLSPKLNIRLNLNYANIERGLNEGLIYSTEDTLRNPEAAKVVNPDAYEKLTNFFYDLSITGKFFKNRNSFTKIRLYSQNSLREYRDEEGSGNVNGILISKNFRAIEYALDLKQNFEVPINRDAKLDLLIGGNMRYNIFMFENPFPYDFNYINFTENYYTGISKLDFYYKNFFGSVMAKYENMYENQTLSGGAEAGYKLIKNNDYEVSIFGGLNLYPEGIQQLTILDPINGPYYSLTEYSNKEVGIKLMYKTFYAKITQYNRGKFSSTDITNGNYEAGFTSQYFDIHTALNLRHDQESDIAPDLYYRNVPKINLKSDISYHNYFFNDNLNLRIGVNLKFLYDMYLTRFNEYYYSADTWLYQDPPDSVHVDNLFNMDFYIGARIGSANIAFVFANVFDNLSYNTFLYPWNDRGGALNALSRFSITWDFLN